MRLEGRVVKPQEIAREEVSHIGDSRKVWVIEEVLSRYSNEPIGFHHEVGYKKIDSFTYICLSEKSLKSTLDEIKEGRVKQGWKVREGTYDMQGKLHERKVESLPDIKLHIFYKTIGGEQGTRTPSNYLKIDHYVHEKEMSILK